MIPQDGHTKGADRQKGMDEFNKPDSDVFIYILSTRAGGVGINLFVSDDAHLAPFFPDSFCRVLTPLSSSILISTLIR